MRLVGGAMARMRSRPPTLAAVVDHEEDALRVYRRALGAFIDVLVSDLSAEQVTTLAETTRSHGGVLVCGDNGGVTFELTVEFGAVLNAAETAAAEAKARAKPDSREFKRERKGHNS